MDSDSYCSGPVGDVFDMLTSQDKTYGYMIEMQDGGDVVEGLWNSAVNYTHINNFEPKFLYGSPHYKDWGEGGIFSGCPMFYTNFEVARMDLLRSAEYQKWFQYIDSLGGIYMHRWGDAPIRWLGLAMFLERSKTLQMSVRCHHN